MDDFHVVFTLWRIVKWTIKHILVWTHHTINRDSLALLGEIPPNEVRVKSSVIPSKFDNLDTACVMNDTL